MIPAMTYSKSGAALTERFEQCRLVAYWDALGKVWTIGWGHTRGVAQGLTCIQAQADAWLPEDMALCEADVNSHVTVPLTQNEFDALCDFSFNLGCEALNSSTLLKQLNAGNYKAAAAEFQKWDHAGGQVVAGLLTRRLAEQDVFES
jgi:lysozyme